MRRTTEGATPAPAASTPAPVTDTPTQVAEKWRAKHETDYRRDWVSIAGLHPLKDGVNTAGSAARNDIVLPESVPARLGAFVLNAGKVRFQPEKDAPVRSEGPAGHRRD